MDQRKPKPQTSLAAQEMDKAQEQFDNFDAKVKEMTLDRMNKAPKLETEQQTKMSQNQIANSNDIYLKPTFTIGSREKFNENYREEYNFAKEYVYFISENKEIIGEKIELWTKPFAGMPAEFWTVPVNKPVWAPRYVAERIKGCTYHTLSMKEHATENNMVGSDGIAQYYGSAVVDCINQRLDARPATKQKSIFLSASGF